MGHVPLARRCLSRDDAAEYMGVSTIQIDRMIQVGALPIVRYGVEREAKSGAGRKGQSRRVLLDVHDLDAYVEQSKIRDGTS